MIDLKLNFQNHIKIIESKLSMGVGIRGGVEDTRLEAKAEKTKKIWDQALPRTDTLEAKDRNARGQGPRTQTQVFSKKKGLQRIFFRRSPNKKRLEKNFQPIYKILTIQKIAQFSRTSGFEAKAKDLTFKATAKVKDFKMCSRGPGHPRGLHLW